MIKEQNNKIKSKEKQIVHRQGSPKYLRLKSQGNSQLHYINLNKAEAHGIKNEVINQLKKPNSYKYIAQIVNQTQKLNKPQIQNERSLKDIKIPQFFRKNNNPDYQRLDLDQNKQKQGKIQKFRNMFNSLKKQNIAQKKLDFKKNIQQQQNNKESIDYTKLNDKIKYLQNKIQDMKQNLEKKRNEKIKFMQTQRTERTSVVFSDQSTSTFEQEEPLRKFITQVPQHKDLHSIQYNPYSQQNSTYYVSQILRTYKQQKSLARQHIASSLEYLKMLQSCKIPNEYSVKKRQLNLSRAKGYEDKKTLIFDLDETLIHCNQNIRIPHDLTIKIKFPTNQIIYAGINIRPYAKEILAALSKKFQIIVFTASHSCYANVVIDFLDPEKKHIQHRLFRQHCYSTPQGVYVKDLRIINRSMSKMILIDNAAYSYAFQLLNGIPILPYYEGKQDYQLKALQKYLQNLISIEDVRQINKSTFKIDKYTEFQYINTLVQKLYGEKT